MVHLPEEGRYEARSLEDDHRMGWLNYRLEGNLMVIKTTNTVPEHRGQGVAGCLAKAALEDALDAGRSVDALCWYVAEYIERNPRYYNLQV
ncbi:MAG: N-acetyltransferase [Promicromonosporaceae bacterium]|nr:N-acetyltransferase [Promicromonosporaceae bacterium]